MSVSDIKRQKTDNLGGLNSWVFIPADHVQEIPPIINRCIHYEVILKPGTRWFEGYGTEGTMSFTDKQQDGDQGSFHVKTFSCKSPDLIPEHSDTLDSLMNTKLILKLFYNNGTVILAGNKEEPLYIRSDHDSKFDVPERNELEIVISGEGVHKSPFYLV